MDFHPTPIRGAYVIDRVRHSDYRGTLERLFEINAMDPVMMGAPVAQINRTYTREIGTIRGMHCQVPPAAETKIVTCTRGMVFDVVVDLRGTSPTFGHWWGVRLDSSEPRSVVVPPGCAHGLQTLSPDVEMIYAHSAGYDPEAEERLNPLNPEVGIIWPVAVSCISPHDAAESEPVTRFKEISW